jgi:subtilase family serine protease
VTDTTSNQGNGGSPPSTTSFYLSTNLWLDSSDVPLGSRTVPALAAGASSTATTTVPVPAGTAPGSYYVLAKADGPEAIAESNETNNVAFGANVRLGPDLAVSALSVPMSVSSGGSFTATDSTTNQGTAPASSTTTRFYLSTNYGLDASDVLIGSRTVSALVPGATDSSSTVLTIPAGTAPGIYYLIAVSDADGEVVEGNEGNNTRVGFMWVVNP